MSPNTSPVVLITGCRSGFGLLFARDAAKAGYRVYAGLRDLSSAEGLVAATEGLDVTPIQLDVTDASQRDAAVSRIVSETGRLDALVNNAGVALGGPLELLEDDEIRHLFEVNVFGLWAMTTACLPTMRAAKTGRIIMVSSMSGRMALPCLGAYAASKFAVEGMSEGWRHELAPMGIDVVLVEPGAYKTDIFGRNRRVGRRVTGEHPYLALTDAVDRLATKAADTARDPQEVSDLVVKLLQKKNPALRYALGPNVRLRNLLPRILPQRLTEGLVKTLVKRASRG